MEQLILPENEKQMIQRWIEKNIDDNPIAVDIDYILRYWYKNKKNLYKLHGYQMDICKDITYEKTWEELKGEFADSHSLEKDIFTMDFYKVTKTIEKAEGIRSSIINSLVQDINLAKNVVPEDVNFIFTDPTTNKQITIIPGMKIMKAIERIAKAYEIASFEKFRIYHSQIHNQKIFKGKLHLSIHPLEFMTLSDNSLGWSSCMSWEEEGSYRRGTIEMMNSPYVLIGYLEAKKPFRLNYKDTWHNVNMQHYI